MSHIFIGTERDVGKTPHYFAERHCTIDYRGTLTIDPTAEFGYCVSIFTRTHPSDWLLVNERTTKSESRTVVVEPRAWVCSQSILYNCIIGEGAVIAAGSVVRSVQVPKFTMVEGNPAVAIARYENGKWVSIAPEELTR